MADEEKRVLLNIESNLDQYKQDAADAGAEVRRLQEEIRELKKSDEASNEQIEEKSQELRGARKEYREATKSVDDLTRANEAQAGSYEELQAQLSLAEKQLKTQSGLLERNADGTIVLSEAYVEASKDVETARGAMNKFNTGIHDGRTSVGLYQESIENAMGGMQVFGVSGTKAMGLLSGGISGMAKTGITWLKALGKAFLTNPAGLIIMAIIGAIALVVKAWDSFTGRYFETTDKMKAVIDGIKAAFDAVVDVFVSFLRRTERAGKSIKEVYEETKRLSLEARQLEDSMKRFEQASAKANLEVAKLELIYRDVTKSDQERMEAAQKAMDIEMKRSEEELEMAQRNLEIIKEKNALSVSGREDIEAEIEAQSKVYQLEERSLRTRQRINRTLSSMEKGMMQEREDNINREQRALIDLQKLRAGDNIDKIKEVLKRELELNLANDELTYNERLLLREQYHATVLAMDNDAAAKRRQKEDEDAAEKKKQDDKDAADRLTKQKEKEDLRRRDVVAGINWDKERLEEKRLMDELSAEDEYNAMMALLSRQRELALENEELTYNERQLILQQYFNQQLQLEATFNESKQELSDIRVQIMRDEAARIGDAIGTVSELMGKETAVGKILAVAQATINTYLAASQVLADPTLPTVSKVAAMIAIIGTGLLNVKKILAVNVPGGGASVSGQSGASRGGGYVASRAGGGIAASDQAFAYAGMTSRSGGDARSEMEAGNNDALIEAISKIRPVVTVEDIQRETTRKSKVEVNASF